MFVCFFCITFLNVFLFPFRKSLPTKYYDLGTFTSFDHSSFELELKIEKNLIEISNIFDIDDEWWSVLVVLLTNKRRLALFLARTIVRDLTISYLWYAVSRNGTCREPELNEIIEWSCAVVIATIPQPRYHYHSGDNHYITSDL